MPRVARAHDEQAELEQAERNGEPARLVGEQAVVGERQGRARRRPSAPRARAATSSWSAARSGRPRPAPARATASARLEPASQRVRHRFTRRRNPCAAYRAPVSVSAPGNAHCAQAPASASVACAVGQPRHRRVRVERDPRPDACARPCSATSERSSTSCVEPAQETGRADDLARPVHRRLDAEPTLARRRGDRLVPLAARAGTRRPSSAGAGRRARRRVEAWNAGKAPAREAAAVGRFSGRRSGSRRRTETTNAPAASAFSHSVAAAIPAPTTTTSSAYSCGSYACTARGSSASSGGFARPGWPGATSTWRKGPCAVELEPAVDRANAVDAPGTEARRPSRSGRELARRASRNSSTLGW